MSTQNVGTEQGVKCLCYGGAGVGKTTLCATAPRPIILSAEAGLLSLRKHNLPFISINTFAELEECYNWVMKSKEAANFDTICLDSISEIGEVVLADLKLKNKDPRKAYGEAQEQMLGLIRSFRDMPRKHVYFTAKMEKVKDEGTNLMLYFPMMPGNKLPQQVPYFFDEIFQLDVFKDPQGQPFRALRTQRDNQFEAKDRSGNLDFWEPPNLAHIFEKIMRG